MGKGKDMKRVINKLYFAVILSVLFAFPVSKAAAQTTATSHVPLVSTTFDMTGFPQWARDLRRWEIVAFGSFPFTMLFSTIAMDTYLWHTRGNFGFDSANIRYAPLIGSHQMNNRQRQLTIVYAAGLSAAIAVADFFVVRSRRQQEMRRVENMPGGTTIITRTPHPQTEHDANFGTELPRAPDPSPP